MWVSELTTVLPLLTLLSSVVAQHNAAHDKGAMVPWNAPERDAIDIEKDYCPRCPDPNMCVTMQHKFLDCNSCACKSCCYTPDERLYDDNYIQQECRDKGQSCQTYARWSACGRHDTYYPPYGTSASPVCKDGQPGTTAAVNPTSKLPTQRSATGSVTSTTLTVTRSITPTIPHTEPILLHASTDVITTVPNSTKPSSIGQTSPEDTTKMDATGTSTALILWIVLAVVMGVAVIVGVIYLIYCCCWRKPKSNPQNDTSPAEVQAPLIEHPSNIQIDAAIQIEDPGSDSVAVAIKDDATETTRDDETIDSMVLSESDESDEGQGKKKAPNESIEMTKVDIHDSGNPATVTNTTATTEGQPSTSWQQEQRKDSGYLSTDASLDNQPDNRVDSYANICTKFVLQLKSMLHDGHFPKAGQVAYEEEPTKENKVSLDGRLSSGVEPVKRELLSSLEFIRQFDLSTSTQQCNFRSAVDKVSSIITGRFNGGDVVSMKEEPFTTRECQDILSLVDLIALHPDFPTEALQEDVGRMRLALNKKEINGSMQLSLPSEQQEMDQKEWNIAKQKEWNAKIEERLKTCEDHKNNEIAECMLSTIDQPAVPKYLEEPKMMTVFLRDMLLVFIVWRTEYMEREKATFHLACDQNCKGNCLRPSSIPPPFKSTPLAHRFPDLMPNHTYKLTVAVGPYEMVERKKTLDFDDVCQSTFSNLISDSELVRVLSDHCDSENGEQLRKNMACLMKCEVKHEWIKFYRDPQRYLVIENLLKERENFPVTVLLVCLLHFGMYEVIEKVSEWHGNCPVCNPMYREALRA